MSIDIEDRYFEKEVRPETPAGSLLRSAQFWEERIGGQKFLSSYVVASLLRVLAREHDDLTRMMKADPSNGSVAVAQGDNLFSDRYGNILFDSVGRALYHLALSSEDRKTGRAILIPPSLIYRLRNTGISREDVYCVTPEMTYRRREIFTLYPVPQHIIEGTL